MKFLDVYNIKCTMRLNKNDSLTDLYYKSADKSTCTLALTPVTQISRKCQVLIPKDLALKGYIIRTRP